MSPIVAAAVPAVLFFALIFGIWHYQRRQRAMRPPAGKSGGEAVPAAFADEPDFPLPFGYSSQWFAVRTTDTRAVADLLRLNGRQRANWRTGLAGADAGYCFVTPPVNGWTLVIQPAMPELTGDGQSGPLPALEALSRAFGEACYFGTHRVVGYRAWARSVDGVIVRGFAYAGSGAIVFDRGEPSEEERTDNRLFTGPEAADPVFPDEEDVRRIAGLWSVDPAMAQGGYTRGTGIIGVLRTS
ncbi:hypothetical protein SAMN02799624_01106 [Paenibacillus sp. UNC496MF]|uniref:hypothetical protein n=1 Tax=Paenibacillus sp. UNC496MF TaxID=1502753 RepID=UPI0008E9FED9|nr:hypothetical protein [Paenibacillus sp. UNC496MF]SFI50715.1 hypothetical protein SAMN02799624_01106 [Paenibacillus sp. UNC496MF]